MNLQEIKDAVRMGKRVCWMNSIYEVQQDKLGQWFIVCTKNHHAIGLTWQDGVTVNGKPEEFYIPLPNEDEFLAGRDVKHRDGQYVIVASEMSANWPQYVDFYRVIDLKTGHESSLYSMGECKRIIELAKSYELKGSFGAGSQNVCSQLQNGGSHD